MSEVELAESSHGAVDRFCELVVAAQGEGWQADVDPRALAGGVWSAVHGLACLWLDESIQPATGARSLARSTRFSIRCCPCSYR
jgi:hypothetical protein